MTCTSTFVLHFVILDISPRLFLLDLGGLPVATWAGLPSAAGSQETSTLKPGLGP